ncbi:hypothetical protein PIB30_090519 [Stylosanthes scabra]|uniref:Uncharacterized protein n=1 Tax=Stylosanthes scabra TaxID=79078 RepID=A0ABU6ZTK7_9FABA|nr:hypothetical protein [Stylosanthes scabra]
MVSLLPSPTYDNKNPRVTCGHCLDLLLGRFGLRTTWESSRITCALCPSCAICQITHVWRGLWTYNVERDLKGSKWVHKGDVHGLGHLLLLHSNTPKPQKAPKSPSTPKLCLASLNPQPPSIRPSSFVLGSIYASFILRRRVLRLSRSLAPSALLSPSLGVLSVNHSENPSRRCSPFADA